MIIHVDAEDRTRRILRDSYARAGVDGWTWEIDHLGAYIVDHAGARIGVSSVTLRQRIVVADADSRTLSVEAV